MKQTIVFQKNHKMADRVFHTGEILDILSDDFDMKVNEKSDFFESDMELSIDGSSDDGDVFRIAIPENL